jgi:hypothetical protein
MAGLVIIDNGKNAARQIGETTESWLLRTGAYATANAINLAVRTAIDKSKPDKKYPFGYVSLPTTELDTLQKKHPESKYTNMRFLQENIPVNNLILKNKNNDFIEFVNAKICVTKQNTIVETPLVNRTGTVKEYIHARDYEINVSGDIMVDTNYYPAFEIGVINEFLTSPEEFKIANVYLESFKIDNMVFKSGDFDQQGQKYFNVLPFRFQFISDNDAENAYGLIMDN